MDGSRIGDAKRRLSPVRKCVAGAGALDLAILSGQGKGGHVCCLPSPLTSRYLAFRPRRMAAGPTNDHSVLDPDVDERAAAAPVEPGAPTPDLAKTASALKTVRARSM